MRGKLVPPSSSRGGASRGLRCACSRRYTHRDSARRTDSRGVRTHGLRGPWVPDGRLEGVRGHWHLDAASRLVALGISMRHQVVGLVASPRVSRVCFVIFTFTFYVHLSSLCVWLLSFAFCLYNVIFYMWLIKCSLVSRNHQTKARCRSYH